MMNLGVSMGVEATDWQNLWFQHKPLVF